jgi:hypothetical protein
MFIAAALGLLMPRLILFVSWLFTDYLERAYDTWIWPVLGFFFLPTTTLCYAIAVNAFDGVRGWGLILTIAGLAIDIGLVGRGRGLFKGARSPKHEVT